MTSKKEIQVVNDALQYWKGFSDALREVHHTYGEGDFENKYKSLYESSVASIEIYKARYDKLRKENSEQKVPSKKRKKENESRSNKRSRVL